MPPSPTPTRSGPEAPLGGTAMADQLDRAENQRIVARLVRRRSQWRPEVHGRDDLPTGYKFVIADDHPLFRGALKQALSAWPTTPRFSKPAISTVPRRLVAGNDDLDLVLLDLSMPGASGLSGLIALRGIHSAVPMVVVSAHDDPVTIRRALELGASGFISKSASIEEIRGAVRRCWPAASPRPAMSSSASSASPSVRPDPQAAQPDAAADARARHARRRPAQQADRLRARRLRSDHQGACLGDPAEARRRQPHPGGDHAVEDQRRIRGALACADADEQIRPT